MGTNKRMKKTDISVRTKKENQFADTTLNISSLENSASNTGQVNSKEEKQEQE